MHLKSIALLSLLLVLSSCTPRSFITGGAVVLADRLYFGDVIPGGEKVSEAAWSDFLRDIVTPRFPNGLTTWRASGQWRDERGTIVREGTFVLEIIHAADADSDGYIDEIISHYKRTFRQESVLWVRTQVAVRF